MKKSGKKRPKSGSRQSAASSKKHADGSAIAERMPVEAYLLRYAFPCTFVIKMRDRVDDATFRMLEKNAIEGKPVDRHVLESVYKKAFGRMKQVAKDMSKTSYWDNEVIREYFVNRHNSMIADDLEYEAAPESIRELCKTVTAAVVEVRDGFLIVKYGAGKTRVVGSVFVPDARIGDSVIVHYGYAIERA